MITSLASRLGLMSLALAACGDGMQLPDASVPPDSARGVLRLRFIPDDESAAQRVYIQNADSTLEVATKTDASGHATVFMNPGSFVTVAVVSKRGLQLYTRADVNPGEELVIDERVVGSAPTAASATRLSITIPEDDLTMGYNLFSSCGASSLTGASFEPSPVELVHCDGTADLLATSASNNFIFRKNVTLVQDATVTLPGPWRPLETTTVTVDHVPSGIDSVFVRQNLVGHGHAIYPSVGDASFGFVAIVNGSGSNLLSNPLPLPLDGTLMTAVVPDQATNGGDHVVVQWGPARANTTIDFGTSSLRPYTKAPVYLPPSNGVQWEEAATGQLADAVYITLAWSRPDHVGAFTWTLLAPRHTQAFATFPVLPLEELQPRNATVRALINLHADGGWDELRALGLLGVWHPEQPNALWPARGDQGRIVYRQLGEPTPTN